jgi:hypothetical protein
MWPNQPPQFWLVVLRSSSTKCLEVAVLLRGTRPEIDADSFRGSWQRCEARSAARIVKVFLC